MELIRALTTESNGHRLRHVIEQRLEEQNGEIEIFTEPSQVRERTGKFIFCQNVLMML